MMILGKRGVMCRTEVTWHLLPLELPRFEDALDLFLFKVRSPVELFQEPTLPLSRCLSRYGEQLSLDHVTRG